MICGRWKKDLKGIFCSNFNHSRGIWSPCRSVWCATCYVAEPSVKFHINAPDEDEGVVWKRKGESSKFLQARSGDFIFTPFQCDVCSFRNIQSRSPLPSSQADQRLLAYIRRANLDAIWSRTPGTISGSLVGIRKILKTAELLNMPSPLEDLGPWPVEDIHGLRLAIAILQASQEGGKNSKEYTQYDSIRKISSAFGNHYEASKSAAINTWVLRSDKTKSHFTDSPARSEFFNRFMKGLKHRMGKDVRGDIPIDYRILHKVLIQLMPEIYKETTLERRRWLASAGTYFILSFVLALRGNETLAIPKSVLWLSI